MKIKEKMKKKISMDFISLIIISLCATISFIERINGKISSTDFYLSMILNILLLNGISIRKKW